MFIHVSPPSDVLRLCKPVTTLYYSFPSDSESSLQNHPALSFSVPSDEIICYDYLDLNFDPPKVLLLDLS